MIPQRIQLISRKGWRLQEVSMALNGLRAIKVDRSGPYGNPFVIGAIYPAITSGGTLQIQDVPDAAVAVAMFRAWLTNGNGEAPDLAPLRGLNCACWCRAGNTCHADVLLEVANR